MVANADGTRTPRPDRRTLVEELVRQRAHGMGPLSDGNGDLLTILMAGPDGLVAAEGTAFAPIEVASDSIGCYAG
jgi:hypothetical protein